MLVYQNRRCRIIEVMLHVGIVRSAKDSHVVQASNLAQSFHMPTTIRIDMSSPIRTYGETVDFSSCRWSSSCCKDDVDPSRCRRRADGSPALLMLRNAEHVPETTRTNLRRHLSPIVAGCHAVE